MINSLSLAFVKEMTAFVVIGHTMGGSFDFKEGYFGSKWDKSWTFSDYILLHFCSAIWKRPRFVQFGANLTHYIATPDNPQRA